MKDYTQTTLTDHHEPGYFVVDMNASLRVSKGLELALHIDNLLDEEYELPRRRGTGRGATEAPQPGLTVWGGVRISYD